MAQILRVTPSAGRYVVLGEDGTALTSHSGKASALESAIGHLHAGQGGEVLVVDESGGVSSRISVGGAAPAVPQQSRASEAAEPPLSEPRGGAAPVPAEVSRSHADAADRAVKAVDEVLGLKDAPPALPQEISDLAVVKVLPENVTKSPGLRVVNTHASVAAAWITVVSLFAGNGTLSAVAQAVRRAANGGATVGDYASVAAVVFAASALCLSVAAAAWAVLSGRVRTAGAVGVWALATAAVSGLLSSMGLAAPSTEQVVAAVDRGSGTPIGWFFSVLGEFFSYYGPVTFLSGLGAGVVIGHLARKIEQMG